MKFISRNPMRTFVIYPILTFVWELIISRGGIMPDLRYLPLMVWGYLQYGEALDSGIILNGGRTKGRSLNL